MNPAYAENGCAGRLSVIIPTYDYAAFLGGCLRSVVSQGVVDVEVIVVDDGSRDDPARVVGEFPGVVLLRQENQGLSAARNTGILASTGEFILFLDADDRLGPDSLAGRLAYLAESDSRSLTVCRNRVFSATDGDDRPRAGASWWLPPTALATRLLYFNIAPPHAWLMRRRVVRDTGLFDTSLRACEDYDYWLRALAHGHVPSYSPAGLVYYRKHRASMSANHGNQWHHDVILHGRVFDALFRSRSIGQHDGPVAVLAAYAGAFTTMARGPGLAGSDRIKMAHLLEQTLPDLAATGIVHSPDNSVLAEYYRLLILTQAPAALAHDASLRGVVSRILNALVAHRYLSPDASRTGRLRSLVQLFGARNAHFIDRYRLARMLMQNLAGHAAA